MDYTGPWAAQEDKSQVIQTMHFSMANNLNALEHSALNYMTRRKKDERLQDLAKAKHCIEMLIAWEEGDRVEASVLGKPGAPNPPAKAPCPSCTHRGTNTDKCELGLPTDRVGGCSHYSPEPPELTPSIHALEPGCYPPRANLCQKCVHYDATTKSCGFGMPTNTRRPCASYTQREEGPPC